MTLSSPWNPSNRADREPAATTVRTTLSIILLGSLLVACGGGGGGGAKPRDTYARGTAVQEQCCENLDGPARDSCLQKIVRVNEPEIASSEVNQEQFACIVDNFTCDPAAGHATQASAQKQMDCLQALQ